MYTMKDRIRQIMESQHMNQTVFSQFIEISSATLSSIFSGRTNPTMNVVGAIKKKIPNISTDWIMFGTGPMYLDPQQHSSQSTTQAVMPPSTPIEPILDFDLPPTPSPQVAPTVVPRTNSVKNTHQEIVREELKFIDKPQRRVIEIRVFYDDQTWDTFIPAKK